jgi:DNA gyrase subunit A
MGVVFARFEDDDFVIGLAKNSERDLETNEELVEASETEAAPAVEAAVEAVAEVAEGDE